jgi:hypothetical protein
MKIFPNWDCLPASNFSDPAARVEANAGPPATVPCFVRNNYAYGQNQGRFLHVGAANYAR